MPPGCGPAFENFQQSQFPLKPNDMVIKIMHSTDNVKFIHCIFAMVSWLLLKYKVTNYGPVQK